MLWFLQLLESNERLSIEEAKASVEVTLEIDLREDLTYAASGHKVFDTKFGWARFYLKHCGLITKSERGFFSITEIGRNLLTENPTELSLRAAKLEDGTRSYQVLHAYPKTKKTAPRARVAKQKYSGDAAQVLAFLQEISQPPELVDTAKSPLVRDGLIELLFGTCRGDGDKSKVKKNFSNRQGTKLKTGVAVVNVPSEHLSGKVERPPWYSWWKEEKGRDFILDSIKMLDGPQFSEFVNEKYRDGLPRVFVFVHGFQVSFESAALRTAQMALDLNLDACPAFFSWPSDVGVLNYLPATVRAQRASGYFADFLEKFAVDTKAAEVVVIAHSMGSEVAASAIALVRNRSPQIAHKLRELVLAAPDLDAHAFGNGLMPVLERLKQNVTVYACKEDVALTISNGRNRGHRVGDIPGGLISNSALETIDATCVASDFFGHSYFSSAESLMADLRELVVGKKRATARTSTLKGSIYNQIAYWTLK